MQLLAPTDSNSNIFYMKELEPEVEYENVDKKAKALPSIEELTKSLDEISQQNSIDKYFP